MYSACIPHVFRTRHVFRNVFRTYSAHFVERIVGDTAKLLDEKGALAGNITRQELRAAMTEIVQQTIDSYERRLGRPATVAEICDESDKVDPKFYQWSNNTFHRLPEDFILTCIGTAERGRIAKTPLQGFLRWNMDDYKEGICPIRMCEPTDFSIRNQRKRYSDWSRLFRGWEELLLEQGETPLLGPARRNATVDDWAARFQLVFGIHCTLIKFCHHSKLKRKRMRKNPSAFLANTQDQHSRS